MGQQVGNQASGNFMMQGVVLAQSMLVGLIKEFMPAGKKRRELLAAINGMVSEAISAMAPIASVSAPSFAPSGASQSFTMSNAEAALVLSNLENIVPGGFDPFAGIPFLANGGIVSSPTLAMVGDGGPEAVIPLSRSVNMGGNTYSITVNTGIGDPRVIGEEVVNVISRFEKANGAVFARA
jgi:hypothetical protein